MVRTRSSLFLGLFMIWSCARVHGQVRRVVRSVDDSAIVDQAIVIAEPDFNLTVVREMCRQFLISKQGNHRLLRLTIGTDPFAVAASLSGFHSPPGKDRYDMLAATISRQWPPRFRIARLMVLRRDALLSYRDGLEFQEEIIKGTEDPTSFKVGQTGYRLLHFVTEGPDGSVAAVRFFLLARSKLSFSDCASATRLFKAMFPSLDITVQVRTNPWFIDSQDYPSVYPF